MSLGQLLLCQRHAYPNQSQASCEIDCSNLHKKKAPSARKKTSIESDCLATQAQWLYVGRMQAKNHQTKIIKGAFTKNKSLNKTNFIYQYLYQITVQEQILYLANCY